MYNHGNDLSNDCGVVLSLGVIQLRGCITQLVPPTSSQWLSLTAIYVRHELTSLVARFLDCVMNT